jgi:Lon protease-like protein
VVALLRRALALQAELGEPAPPVTVEVDVEAEGASHQVCALAPLGPLDRQRLLAAPSTADRLRLARESLDDAVELLEARLAMG